MEVYFESLKSLGLSEKEVSLYLALLKLGQASVQSIARESGVNRSTTYLLLDGLRGKGFVSETNGKKKLFSPLNPKKLLALERQKLSSLEFALPGLLGMVSHSQTKPSTRFFTGKEGVVSVYEESLLLEHGSEILALGHAQAVEAKLPKFRDWYIKRRVKYGIRMRAITPSTPGSLAVAGRDRLELRQTRVLKPEQFTEEVEINIYNNKVSMVSLVEGELIGMITESRVFASAHRQIFELLWSIAKTLK